MGAEPRLWILSKGRKGDLDQMLALADAVGWPCEVKRLSFARPEIPVLAPVLLKATSDPLSPPWPDVVMCAEALPCAIARRLKRQSGGKIRTVCLGRPAGDAGGFRSRAHHRAIPAAARRQYRRTPDAAGGRESRAGTRSSYEFSGTRPLIALIVGGSAFPDVLDDATAERLAASFRPTRIRAAERSLFTPAPARAMRQSTCSAEPSRRRTGCMSSARAAICTARC